MDEIDDDNEIDNLVPVLLFLAAVYGLQQPRLSSNRMHTDQKYIDNLLTYSNDIHIYNQIRMKLNAFNMLQDWLVENTKLDSS